MALRTFYVVNCPRVCEHLFSKPLETPSIREIHFMYYVLLGKISKCFTHFHLFKVPKRFLKCMGKRLSPLNF